MELSFSLFLYDCVHDLAELTISEFLLFFINLQNSLYISVPAEISFRWHLTQKSTIHHSALLYLSLI